MGESDSEIPEKEGLASEHPDEQGGFRDREKELHDIDRDPFVNRAIEIMSDADESFSPLSRAFEAYLELKAKPNADPAAVERARRAIADEVFLESADQVTDKSAVRFLHDVNESLEQRDRDKLSEQIATYVREIEGLEREMHAMATEAVGETTEKYPDEMKEIFKELRERVSSAMEIIAFDVFKTEENDIAAFLSDTRATSAFPSKVLDDAARLLRFNRDKAIDLHSKLLKVVSDWRKQHPA